MILIGQDRQASDFLSAMRGARLHHAWLLTGMQGIGKAGFAEKAAARLLADASGVPVQGEGLSVPESHPAMKLIEAGSHPDLIILRRLEKEKTGDLARNITIDQVRKLISQFSLAPSQGSRRAVIIDAIEDMERGAANALLKALEEPPAGTVFFLVCHAPDRILPTIRSRCRMLRFPRLDDAQVESVLRRIVEGATEAEVSALVRLAEGIPGKALAFAGLDISGMDSQLSRLSSEGDRDNSLRHTLATQLSGKAALPRYEAFLARAPAYIARLARQRKGVALARAIGHWEQAQAIAGSAIPQSMDNYMTVYALASHVAALAPANEGAKA